jgi:hypothetical protein
MCGKMISKVDRRAHGKIPKFQREVGMLHYGSAWVSQSNPLTLQ